MSDCELCGSKNARRKSQVEGATLTVCDRCVSMGKEVIMPNIRPIERPKFSMPEELELSLRSDAANIIKQGREKRGLNQEQLAQKLTEKVSVVKRAEEGWVPPMSTIKKFERFFGVTLMESPEPVQFKAKMQKKPITIGDIAEITG